MPSKFRLASFKTCPWVQRAAIVLGEKGIDYDIDYIDRDNRPEWFLAISPHSKVPVLQVDGERALFESNAIAEYIDETVPPRLHPEDPFERARNRAWTDYVPTFAATATGGGHAMDEETFNQKRKQIPAGFNRLEEALGRRGNDGPYFNGADFSLLDAAYAPFLQRFTYLDRIRPLGVIDDYPLLGAWRAALMARESVTTPTVAVFGSLDRDHPQNRGLRARPLLRASPPAARSTRASGTGSILSPRAAGAREYSSLGIPSA